MPAGSTASSPPPCATGLQVANEGVVFENVDTISVLICPKDYLVNDLTSCQCKPLLW